MLESSSCKRGKDIECTLNETEERRSLIADTENVKSDFSTERKFKYAFCNNIVLKCSQFY